MEGDEYKDTRDTHALMELIILLEQEEIIVKS